MSQEADGLVYRPYVAEDIPFIYSSWGHSYYDDAKAKRQHCPSPTEFHSIHRPVIDHFFARPTATVIVVHHVDEPSVIIAWIALEDLKDSLAIHYIYIKGMFRRRGLLSRLINRVDQKKPIIITHMTDRVSRIMNRNPDKYKRFTYLPLT